MARKRTRKERIAQRLLFTSVMVALAGAAIVVWLLYYKVIEFRIAVANQGAEDAAILNAVNDWMVSDGRRFRLRLVAVGSQEAALEAMRKGDADMAVARGDRVWGADVASIMVLFTEVAGVVVPNAPDGAEWAELNKAAIAVPRGTAPDDPLLLALLRLNGVAAPRIVALEGDQLRQAFEKKQVQALGFVSPLPGYASRAFSTYFGSKAANLAMPGIEDPDLMATRDRRFTAAQIVAGSLRASPPVPNEAVGTLAIGRHIITNNNVNGFRIAQFVRALIDARRALFTHQPLFRQAGQPDLETDSFIKVHESAKRIYYGDEPSWRDLAMEWVYIIPMLLGAIGTIGIWLFQRYIHPEFTDPGDLVSDLLDVRLDASEAADEYALFALKRRIDEIAEELTSEAYEYADIEGTGAVLTAMLIAENQIGERRAQLRNPGHALKCPPDAAEPSASEKVAHALADARAARATA